MIKKIIGVVVALAAIAVIVLATMHSEKFKSLVFDEQEPASAVQVWMGGEAAEPEASTAPDGELPDSVTLVQPDTARMQ